MIDLTPLEVRKKKGDFRKAMRGYEPQAVDDFIDLVADRLEQLVRENASLSERVRSAETQIADYRERERALTEALVTAQEMREEMRRQMEREVDIKMREVEADVESMRSTAAQMREREEENVRRLRARQTQFVQSYRAFLERELAEIGVMAQTLNLSTQEDQAATAPRKRARKGEPAAALDEPPAEPLAAPKLSISPAVPIAAAIAIPLVVPPVETAVEAGPPVAKMPVEELLFEEEEIEPVRVAEPEPEPASDHGLIDLDAVFAPDPELAAEAGADAIEAAMFALDPLGAPSPSPSGGSSTSQLDLSDIPFDEQEMPEIELIDEVEDEDKDDDEDPDGWVSTLLEGKGD